MKYIGIRYLRPRGRYEFTVDKEMAKLAYEGNVEALAKAHENHPCDGFCVGPVERFESQVKVEGRFIERS